MIILVKRKTKILIVEDHPLVRRALKSFIEVDGSFKVCGEAETSAQTISAIRKQRPDLVLLDLFLREDDGLTLTKEIRERHARLPIVVLTMHRAEIFERRARRAGADDFIMKNEATERLFPVLRGLTQSLQRRGKASGRALRQRRGDRER